jgi:hypothetical protein
MQVNWPVWRLTLALLLLTGQASVAAMPDACCAASSPGLSSPAVTEIGRHAAHQAADTADSPSDEGCCLGGEAHGCVADAASGSCSMSGCMATVVLSSLPQLSVIAPNLSAVFPRLSLVPPAKPQVPLYRPPISG